jgi:hypothetical protein
LDVVLGRIAAVEAPNVRFRKSPSQEARIQTGMAMSINGGENPRINGASSFHL